jgi:hypothetical protein
VCDHQHAIDVEQVGRHDERPDHVVGDARTGDAQDLRVPGAQPERLERLDPRIDGREDG